MLTSSGRVEMNPSSDEVGLLDTSPLSVPRGGALVI